MALTIAEHCRVNKRTSGFDYMRIGLSVSIILWHGISLSYGRDVELVWWHSPVGTLMRFVLPMFFALSGFLVAGSLDRCQTLISFFGLRILRIFPALAVEVVLSALVFGPLLTSSSLADYFEDAALGHYFLNIAGNIHFELPGLFQGNPFPGVVNLQLWTIPFELQCYLAIGGLAAGSVLRHRSVLLWTILLSSAIWAWAAISFGVIDGAGPMLVIAFLVGALFHLYRDRIQLRLSLFLVALVSGYVLSGLTNGAYFMPIPAAYMTVYLGLLNPPTVRLMTAGDYSYGLYLYAYPLQQAIASVGPATHHWWINVGVTLPLAFSIAFISWHKIERPMLALRRWLPPIENAVLRLACPVATPATNYRGTVWIIDFLALFCGVLGPFLLVMKNEELAVVIILASFTAGALAARLRWRSMNDTAPTGDPVLG